MPTEILTKDAPSKDPVTSISSTKAALDTALAKYRAIAQTAPAPAVKDASDEVKRLQKQLSSQITDGANPCPHCWELPHGMEQPASSTRVEYEIGCLKCGPFEHTDGTQRLHKVRGGLMPQHVVDAWNAGPDFWEKAK